MVKHAGVGPLPLFPGGKRKAEAKKLNAIVSRFGALSTIWKRGIRIQSRRQENGKKRAIKPIENGVYGSLER
jgi:hypothetical protein